MTLKHAIKLLTLLLFTLVCSGRARADVIAEDDATSAVYTDGWTTGDDGGTGFGPWFVYNLIQEAIPESTEVDAAPADAANSLGSPAFKLATGGIAGSFFISRPFDAALAVGQTFSMEIDSYPLDQLGEPGRDLGIGFTAGEDTRLSMYGYVGKYENVTYGTDFFGINATTANNNLAGGASLPEDPLSGIQWQTNYTATDGSDGFTLLIDIPTIDTYRLRVIDDSVTKLDISGEMSGPAGAGINGFYIFGDDYGDFFGEEPLGGVMYFTDLKIESAAALEGDFDNDGDVDGRDFLVWQRGNSPSPLSAGDLADWQNNFGAPGLAAISAAPEPTGLVLLSMAVVSFLGRRK
jgi:hypothetical protein